MNISFHMCDIYQFVFNIDINCIDDLYQGIFANLLQTMDYTDKFKIVSQYSNTCNSCNDTHKNDTYDIACKKDHDIQHACIVIYNTLTRIIIYTRDVSYVHFQPSNYPFPTFH